MSEDMDVIRDLLAAACKALNYIMNTEYELGIALDSGDALRAAITKANEELRAEVEEQARLNGMGAEHELSLRATIDRLTKERDEARAEADPELLTIAWMDGSHRSAKAARDEIKRLTKERDEAVEIRDRALLVAGERKVEVRNLRNRLSAMQEAIDEAVSRADLGTVVGRVITEPLRNLTKPEPEVDPLVLPDSADSAKKNGPQRCW